MPSLVIRTSFVIPVGQLRIDQTVVRLDLNGDNAAFANVSVIRKVGFLNNAGASRKNDMKVFVPGLIDDVRAGS